ncbi:OmpA family protein [Desulfuromonas sp. TF]|uniref:OmpA family protein n=1 Tax=Desulfuromonas sp. TF TaxID=1232410 RepID=UPI000417C913|nr:OmpA family protein [Desulfuromonas sp. TF]
MNTKWFGTLSLLFGTVLLASCAAPQAPLEFKSHAYETGKYSAKYDNVQIILDTSQSMDLDMHGKQEYPTARNFVSSLNQSIPSDITYNAGLRTFGHDPKQSNKPTAIPYGMTMYTRSGLAGGLDSIKYLGGESPLDEALKAAGEDLKSATGNSAIVVVSDGVKMEDSPEAAAKVKAAMGESLCIYTVMVGDSPEGKKTLEGVAKAGQCGMAVNAADLTDPDKFAGFVKQVFLTDKPVMAAPAPPPPPGDSDGDGVTDDRDKCPNTLRGAVVDKDGCELKYTMQIEFGFDKTDIPPEYHAQLAEAAAFVKRYPTTQILVAGHTDSTGEEIYNIELSMRRAKAVKAYIVENFGVDGSRLFPRGFGENRPVATNDTAEGRQENRRVEFICCVVIPKE